MLGLFTIIWRHNSEPIDPPAPVTITVLPKIFFCNNSLFGKTGSRPSKSSIFTSLSSSIFALPCKISSISGIVLTLIFKGIRLSIIAFLSEREALGMASKITFILYFFTNFEISLGEKILFPKR